MPSRNLKKATYPYKQGREQLHRYFEEWCRLTRRLPLTAKEFKAQLKQRFADRLEERQLTIEKKQNWYWVGVRIGTGKLPIATETATKNTPQKFQ